jgi:hypothetical protein
VPITAPPTVLSVEAFCAVVPTWCAAHWRHAASSTWNCSKFFPLPGKTMTLGPCGTVAQPLSSAPTSAITTPARPDPFIAAAPAP